MIKGIALDLEGTTVDVERAHHEGHIAAAAEVNVGLTLVQAYQLLPHFIGGPDRMVAEDIWIMAGQPKTVSVDEILASTLRHYQRLLAEIDIVPRPGVIEAIAEFRRLGLSVSIGSLTAVAQARMLLERTGLRTLIGDEMIVLKEHVKNQKPAPDVFLESARRMGIEPKDQLVFEDSPRGAQAALSAGSQVIGMPVVLEPFESTVMPLKKAGAYWIYRDWREFNLAALIDNLNNGT